MEAQLGDADPVDLDVSLGRLDDAEESQGERGLPCSRAPNYAHLIHTENKNMFNDTTAWN